MSPSVTYNDDDVIIGTIGEERGGEREEGGVIVIEP